MRKTSSKLQKATAWLLAMVMSLSAMQPNMAYADAKTSDPATEITSNNDSDSDGYASIDIQANEDDSSILDVKTSNTKNTNKEIRLHLWEFDEGFFEDYEFTKTPEKSVTVKDLTDTKTAEVTMKSGKTITMEYIIDEDNNDYYISFAAEAQTEYEFNIKFASTQAAAESRDFVVEPEIVDAGADDTVSDPIQLTVFATLPDGDEQVTPSAPESTTSTKTQSTTEPETSNNNGILTLDDSNDNLCGENAYWSLEETEDGHYKLIISGTGEMYDYSEENPAPWYDQKTEIAEIEVQEGITYIGNYAFAYSGYNSGVYAGSTIDSCIIPDTVTMIGNNVLHDINNIWSITLPFAGRSENEGGGFEATFNYLIGEKSDSENTNTTYTYHTYDGYNPDTFLDDQDEQTATEIAATVFKSIHITRQTYFPDFTFSGISRGAEIILPENAEYIGNYIFFNSYNIKYSVSERISLAPYAFVNAHFTSLSFAKGCSIDTISNQQFKNAKINNLYLPSTIKAFDGNGNVLSFLVGTLYINDLSSLYEIDYINGATNIIADLYDSITTLYSLYYENERIDITQLTTPDEITKIGENAFAGVESLESISLSSNISEIKSGAFTNCTKLESINLDSVNTIGESAFSSCTSLKSVTLSNGITAISKDLFKDCRSLERITIPASVTTIEAGAFSGCTSLREVVFEDGSAINTIPQDAFSGCSSLESINLPDTIETISDNAFQDCVSLTAITLPDNVQSIGADAFSTTALTSIQLPTNIKVIGDEAFANSTSLAEVNGQFAIEGIYELFPDTQISSNAFINTGLASDIISLGETFTVEKDGLAVTVETGESHNRVPSLDENGRLLYYTGETATTTISISNPSGSTDNGNSIKIYMDSSSQYRIDMEEGSFTINVGESSYTGIITKAENRYTIEVPAPNAGDTISFTVGSQFASGTTGGGIVNISAEIVSQDGSSEMSNGAQIISWGTNPNPYAVTERLRDTWVITGSGENDGIAYLNGLSYTVTASREGVTLEGIGEDPLQKMHFTDTLTLPDGWHVAEDIKESLQNGDLDYTASEAIFNGNSVVNITSSSNVILRSVSLSDDEAQLIVEWDSLQSNAYEYVITFGDHMFTSGSSIGAGDEINVINDIKKTAIYTYSGPQNSEDSVSSTMTAQEGSIDLSYEMDIDTYRNGLIANGKAPAMGNDSPFIITLNNPGVTSASIGDLSDSIPLQFYLSADGIESLFDADVGEFLELTITNGTITTGDSIYDITGYDGGAHQTTIDDTWAGTLFEGLLQPNPDSYVNDYSSNNGATITFTKGNGCIVMNYDSNTYTIGVGCYYESVAAALGAINFKNTYYTQYSLEWDFDSTNEIIYGGETITINIPTIAKDSFMMLTKDSVSRYNANYVLSYAIPGTQSNSVVQLRRAGGIDYYKTAAINNIYFYMDVEIELLKYDNVQGKESLDGALSDGAAIEEGSVSIYRNVVTLTANSHRDQVPLVNHITGSQVVMLPMDENKNAEWEGDAEVYKSVDGNNYYLLTKEGIYENVSFGRIYDSTSMANVTYPDGLDHNTLIADKIVVKNTEKGLQTTIYWYIEKINEINTSRYQYYPERCHGINLIYEVLNTSKYSNAYDNYYSTTAYLGDYQGHRLVDSFGGVSIDIDKNIVSSVGDEETESKSSSVGAGDSVTYRLTIESTTDYVATTTGSEMGDVLPLSIPDYRWSKDNVDISYSGFESVSDKSEEAWSITDAAGSTNQQTIKWDDDFTIRYNEPAYIWVTLTFPADTQWEQYVNAYGSTVLTNTFRVDGPTNLSEAVSHVLKLDTEVVLQKGVYATGSMSGNSGDYYNESRLNINTNVDSRYQYPNSTSDKAFVAYYVVLYNDGDSNLYLTDMTDIMPEGFEFRGLATSRRTTSSSLTGRLYARTIVAPVVGDAHNGTPNSSELLFANITDNNGSDVTYKVTQITSTINDDGTVTISFPHNDFYSGDISYDDTIGMSYLKPGEAIQFAYVCATGDYDETLDVSCNSIAMPIYNRSEGNISVGDSDITVYDNGVDANDGDCSLINSNEAVAKGFTDTADDTQWVTSSVNVYRGGIKPGITKSLTSSESVTGITTNAPVVVNYNDELRWDIKAHNDGTNALVNYTITDKLPYPYMFTGDVTYSVYGSSDLVVAHPNSGNSQTKLFTIVNLQTRSDGLAESMTIEYYPYNSHTPTTKVIQVGEDAEEIEVGWSYRTNAIFNDSGTEPGRVLISLSYDDTGDLCMSLQFLNSTMAIPVGGYGAVTYYTENYPSVITNKTYINSAYLTPMIQTWDGNTNIGNYTESGPTAELEGLASVRNSAPVTVSNGYATTSNKTITENDNQANTASSTGERNFIVIEDASKEFIYDLSVDNISDRAMDELILIDNLPEAEDHDTFDADSDRESEFTVSLSNNPAFTVTVRPDNANASWNEYTLTPDQYTIQYSEKTEYTSDDWSGAGDGWTSYQEGADLSSARSIRLIILDEEGTLIPSDATVNLSFAAKADAGAKSGGYAWNSFGYHYSMADSETELEAAPLKVGVAITGKPVIQKAVVNVDGEPTTQEEDTVYRYILYKGTYIDGIDESSTAEELTAALAIKGTEFSYIELNVPAGETASEQLDLSDIYVCSYSEENGFVETSTPWTWENDSSYALWEIPDKNYNFINVNGGDTINNTYVFTYTNTRNQILQCTNELIPDTFDIRVNKYYSETVGDATYAGAVKDAILQVWNADRTEMLAEQTVDETGYVTFTELEAGDYVLVEAEAPDHFVIADDIAFTVNEDGTITTEDAENVGTDDNGMYLKMKDEMENGTIIIQKFEDDGETPLAGVTYTLYDSDDQVIDTKITGEDGRVTFTKVPFGDYTIVETKTAEGYSLLAEPIYVTIPLVMTAEEAEENDADTTQAFYDEATDSYIFFALTYNVTDNATFVLPTTGSNNLATMAVGGVGALIILTGAYLTYRRKKGYKGILNS